MIRDQESDLTVPQTIFRPVVGQIYEWKSVLPQLFLILRIDGKEFGRCRAYALELNTGKTQSVSFHDSYFFQGWKQII